MAGYGNAEYIARALALKPQIEEANPGVDLERNPLAKAVYGTQLAPDFKFEKEGYVDPGQGVDPGELGQGAAAGGMAAGPAGALIGAGASLVSQLGAQQQQREMAKIQNEMIRRRNLQQTIEEGSLGMQNALQQRLANLSKAYFS